MPEKKRVRQKDMPSSVTNRVSPFDKFANTASEFVSKAWFFAFCVLLILIWAPTYFLLGSIDTWQLIINTATTIITFLLVALLQNTQQRADHATQHKLNAIADALADLMRSLAVDHPRAEDLQTDLAELRQSVGLEHKESS
jgi:low affinity Fe/Cu permease